MLFAAWTDYSTGLTTTCVPCLIGACAAVATPTPKELAVHDFIQGRGSLVLSDRFTRRSSRWASWIDDLASFLPFLDHLRGYLLLSSSALGVIWRPIRNLTDVDLDSQRESILEAALSIVSIIRS